MVINTCASAISFAKELENTAEEFYQYLAQKYIQDAEIFLSFAKENQKNIITIERTYYGVISDAIEGCFAFNINPDEYRFGIELSQKPGYIDDIAQATDIEEKIIKFYTDAAEQSRTLMADVPRVFSLVAKKRSSRLPRLKELVDRVSK